KRQKKKCKKRNRIAPAANRTRGPSMATMDFTTKPLALIGCCQKFLSAALSR
ncbi:hypothetical protein QR685DRAFT_448472, partial [Neurospora intermedia]